MEIRKPQAQQGVGRCEPPELYTLSRLATWGMANGCVVESQNVQDLTGPSGTGEPRTQHPRTVNGLVRTLNLVGGGVPSSRFPRTNGTPAKPSNGATKPETSKVGRPKRTAVTIPKGRDVQTLVFEDLVLLDRHNLGGVSPQPTTNQ